MCGCARLQSSASGSMEEKSKAWDKMKLEFVSKTIQVNGRTSSEVRDEIERELDTEGNAVRWAIVEHNEEEGSCRVDAIISQ